MTTVSDRIPKHAFLSAVRGHVLLYRQREKALYLSAQDGYYQIDLERDQSRLTSVDLNLKNGLPRGRN